MAAGLTEEKNIIFPFLLVFRIYLAYFRAHQMKAVGFTRLVKKSIPELFMIFIDGAEIGKFMEVSPHTYTKKLSGVFRANITKVCQKQI